MTVIKDETVLMRSMLFFNALAYLAAHNFIHFLIQVFNMGQDYLGFSCSHAVVVYYTWCNKFPSAVSFACPLCKI